MEVRNIFLTGKKRSGKSTLINNILKELNINYSGYRTLPYYIKDEGRGFYINGYVDCVGNYSPISIKVGEEKCIPIIDTFEIIGTSILEKSIEDKNSELILLDEIGRLETKAEAFKAGIIKVLDSRKIVLGVLQKVDNDFLKDIKNREDTLVFDIDDLVQEEKKELYLKIVTDLRYILERWGKHYEKVQKNY